MIRAYVGLPGAGKTISMINDAIKHLEKGRRVVSNINFEWKTRKGIIKPIFLPGEEFEKELLVAEKTLFLIDEASIYFPSYFWNKLSMDYIIKLAQVRHYGMDIFYTSQGYNHTIKRLRDLTNIVVKCKCVGLGKSNFWINNVWYDPEIFDIKVFNEVIEKKYVIWRKTIPFWKLSKLYKAFDSTYIIDVASKITK